MLKVFTASLKVYSSRLFFRKFSFQSLLYRKCNELGDQQQLIDSLEINGCLLKEKIQIFLLRLFQ